VQLASNAIAGAIDLFGGRSQVYQQVFRHRESHFRLCGDHDIRSSGF
jgi:hypothetical protein